jgi:hypothetical protein
MSDHNQASQTPTTRGAIRESRHGEDQRTTASHASGSPQNADWSGVSSGAEGTIPTGMRPAGSTGSYDTTTSTSASSGYGSTSRGPSSGSASGSSMSGSGTSGSSGGSGSSSRSDSGSGGSGSGEEGGAVDKVIGATTQKMGAISDSMSGMTDQAASKADAGMEKAASGLDTLAGTIRDKSQTMGGGQMQSIASTAADKMESGAEMLRHTDSEQLVSELEALVRRKPVESMLVAAGIGFLFAKAMR